MRALTVDAIVEEAGVNRSAIRYYFGNKAGLLAAVVDSLLHDEAARVSKETSELPRGEERVHSFVSGMQHIAEDTESFGVFFNILGETMRDDTARARLAELYSFFYDLHLGWLGGADSSAPDDLKALARLLVAVTDGLGVQHFLEGDEQDLSSTFALFARMVERALDEMQATS
jgi:AcrR family transcriptional regulator